MSTDPVLPAVHSPSGLLHLAPDDTLWSIFQYPDSDRLLIRRYDAQDRALPDWHLDQAGYDDYRARHPQIGLPDLGAPSEAESTPAGEPGTAEVETRHIAHAGSWSATSIEPDWCEVCAEPVPFDSHADLSDPVRASPNVKARGTPVYGISHLGRGVQGSVGEGLESGTSGASGHVQILSGQTDVKVNGLMVGRHDSLALINCNAQGCGGALAQLQVSFKPTSAIDQVGRELSMTPAELRQRMAQYREEQAAANARADAIDRQIAELRRQADQASSWNPLNAERRAIARQIRSLQASQRSAASSALWYGEQALQIVERLHPETIGMPGISATPDPQEARELARRQADIERGWAVIDARRRGFGGALASMAGAPPELADAVNGFTSFGRGQTLRPVSHAALPRRRPRTSAPAQAPQQPVRPQQPQQPPQPAPAPAPARPRGRPPATPPPRPGVYVQPPPRTPPSPIAAPVLTAQSLGIPTNINPKQVRHIPPVTDGRSVLTADPSRLLSDVHSGHARILRQPKSGQVIVDFGRPIGQYWKDGRLVGDTNFGSIMYGKNGAHIVPAGPTQW